MLYLKALHIIFVVTWFAGMFYIVRLFIYHREAQDKPEPDKTILTQQMALMSKRLWYGITWPSAVLTLIFGPWVMYEMGYFYSIPEWLWIKIALVTGLYIYHYTLHRIFKQQEKNIYKYSSQQLRIWNEVATIFLVAIVFIVVVKQSLSPVWGLLGLVLFIILLMSAIKMYKLLRSKN
jgi:protoporphyrinogen IX oxidase